MDSALGAQEPEIPTSEAAPPGLLALFLAFARVYAGVHYPGDVVGGLLLGAVIASALVIVLRRPVTTLAFRLAQTPLRPLLAARALAPPSQQGFSRT